MVFLGNTTNTATASALNLPAKIISFSLANKAVGTVQVTVGFVIGSAVVDILYNNDLSAKTSYVYTGKPIVMPPTYRLFVQVTGGGLDYVFHLETF